MSEKTEEVSATYPEDRWSQIIFENANKYHLHQDNLRWSLSAGFAAFFFGGVNITNGSFSKDNPQLIFYLQIALTVMGSMYYLVLMMEGWYYNLMLAHLVECEERVWKRERLRPLIEFDRDRVPAFHPTFACVLVVVATGNTFQLYEAAQAGGHFVRGLTLSLFYILSFVFFALAGQVPRRIDATLNKEHRSKYIIRWPKLWSN